MLNKAKPKERVSYRFFDKTLKKLDSIVKHKNTQQAKKQEFPGYDRTKVLEWLVNIYKFRRD